MTKPTIEKLIEIMAALRDPQTGCPWDIEQNFSTIAPYTIEEAYEVSDAVARNDMADLRDELGDLLLQVVFHARMAEEDGHFDFAGVVEAICDKMIRRHPHVFGDEAARGDAQRQLLRWEDIKADERGAAAGQAKTGALDGVALALPALQRAQKLGKRAARVGFDWPDTGGVYAKLDEEVAELREAVTDEARTEEFGDVLFTMAQLARHLGIDAEESLRQASTKFTERFQRMESEHDRLDALNLDALEAAWERAKATEDGVQD